MPRRTASDEVIVRVAAQVAPAVTSYAYNADGDRISQTADSVTTSYVVNSVPKLASVVAETTGSATSYFVYGHDLLYSVKADGPHYHHADALGSTIAVTGSTGTVEQTMDYDVFGQRRSITGTSSGTTDTFTGEESDSSGLIYLRARYYDPSTGRFLSRDPYPADAADMQTINRYVYVKNNPTNYVDPSGEFFNPLHWVQEKARQARGWTTRQAARARQGVRNSATVRDFQDTRTQMRAAHPGEDNIDDALRHAHTNESLTQRHSVLLVEGAGAWNEVQGIDATENRGGSVNWQLTAMDLHNNQVGVVAGLLPDWLPFGTIENEHLLIYKPGDYLRYYAVPPGDPWMVIRRLAFALLVIQVACRGLDPTYADVTLENASQDLISRATISVARREYEIVDLRPGERRTVSFITAGDGSYRVDAKFQSGRSIAAESIGYIGEGMPSRDTIRVSEGGFELIAGTRSTTEAPLPLTR